MNFIFISFTAYLQPFVDSEVGHSIPRKVIYECANGRGVPFRVVRRVSVDGAGYSREVFCVRVDTVRGYRFERYSVPPAIAVRTCSGIVTVARPIIFSVVPASSDLSTREEELDVLLDGVVSPEVVEEAFQR